MKSATNDYLWYANPFLKLTRRGRRSILKKSSINDSLKKVKNVLKLIGRGKSNGLIFNLKSFKN